MKEQTVHEGNNPNCQYEIFENERCEQLNRFSSHFLLKHERKAFYNGNNTSNEFFDLIPLDLRDQLVWSVQITEKSDRSGWYYAKSFEDIDNGISSPCPLKSSCVRTRKWGGHTPDENIMKLRTSRSSMQNKMTLARTVFRAATIFSQSTFKILRPVLINIVSAGNLRASDIDGTSDPYVIVNAFPNGHNVSHLSIAKYTVKTSVKRSTLIPTWCEKILIPGISGNGALTLTVVDYDVLSRDDFLGQSIVHLNDFKHPLRYQNLELPLKGLQVPPQNDDLLPISLGDSDLDGQGVLRIEIIPLPLATSMVGFLKVDASNTSTNGKLTSILFGKDASVYQRKWVVLTGTHLDIHDPESRGVVPEVALPLDQVTRVQDFPERFEITCKGQQWKFCGDPLTGSLVQWYNDRKQWIAKITLAVDIQVDSCEEALQARKNERDMIQKQGVEILKASSLRKNNFKY